MAKPAMRPSARTRNGWRQGFQPAAAQKEKEKVRRGAANEDLYGQMPARELAARCRRRLWPEARNLDPGLADEQEGRCFVFGRPAGYLRSRTEELLCLAESAGDGIVSWG